MMNDDTKMKFAEFLANEAKTLLLEHMEAVEEAAVETKEEDKPAKAKVSISFGWDADDPCPAVQTRLNYTVSHKDETERKFDPDQTKLDGIE